MDEYDATTVALAQWEKSFRAAAEADNYKIFEALLLSLDLPEDPNLVLDGTIVFVQRCVAYMTLDDRQVMAFLAQQQYDPAKVADAPYRVTFNLHHRAYACVNLPASLGVVDLADLYGTPWEEYRAVGYCDFWIARADGVALRAKEITDFEETVECDLRFDYCEEELSFWADPDTHKGVLQFTVQDVYDFEEEDKDNAPFLATDLDDTLTTGGK